MTDSLSQVAEGYEEFLRDLKERIRGAQVRAALAVNRELVSLYWNVGRDILTRQQQLGWGAKVIDRLAADLRHAFPELKGFSPRNLKYMRALAEAYPDEQLVQQVVAQIPWGHNVRLLDAVNDPAEREWYLRQAIEHGWSRSVLVHQIESGLYNRQGKALTNFERTLPVPQSELAQQILKDPYNFDFLTLGEDALERDLERGLLEHVRKFLLELGVGFAFIGTVSHGNRRAGFLPRPLVLPSKAPLLCCNRPEGSRVPARVRRQDELLPFGGGRPAAPRRRPADHLDYSMQDQKRGDSGIRPARHG